MSTNAPQTTRRDWLIRSISSLAAAGTQTLSSRWIAGSALASVPTLQGCGNNTESRAVPPENLWGKRGLSEGRFQKPRAMAVTAKDSIFIIDMTARIQRFDSSGKFELFFRTPTADNGRPTGVSVDRAGNIMVADTHYFRVLFYTQDGELLEQRTIGGTNGGLPGQFGFVTDAVQDSQGCYYISEYGQWDRIQKFTPEGKFICQWGKNGSDLGNFQRPQCIRLDSEDRIWVADACNHRIQIFECPGDQPKLVTSWGKQGSEAGQFQYPYSLLLDGKGHVYVSEFGAHRVQKLKLDGTPLDSWGIPGREPGELANPWAIEQLSDGSLLVLDTGNNRVQQFRL